MVTQLHSIIDHETRTLLRLDVFQCRICIVSDTDIYNYTKLYEFFSNY